MRCPYCGDDNPTASKVCETCGVSYGFRTDENLKKEMIKQSQQHAEKLIGLIQSVA